MRALTEQARNLEAAERARSESLQTKAAALLAGHLATGAILSTVLVGVFRHVSAQPPPATCLGMVTIAAAACLLLAAATAAVVTLRPRAVRIAPPADLTAEFTELVGASDRGEELTPQRSEWNYLRKFSEQLLRDDDGGLGAVHAEAELRLRWFKRAYYATCASMLTAVLGTGAYLVLTHAG